MASSQQHARMEFLLELRRRAKTYLNPTETRLPFQGEEEEELCVLPHTTAADTRERRALSSSNIEKGSRVFSNAPSSWVLHAEHLNSHCSACCRTFIDKDLFPSSQCGSCKMVKYCSRACQVLDWRTGGHSAECKHIAIYHKKLNNNALNDLRLLVRTYSVAYSQSSKKRKCHVICRFGAGQVIECGLRHLNRLSPAAGAEEFGHVFDGTPAQDETMITLEQAAYILSQEGEENVNFNKLLFLLAAFRTNNFGIVDDLFTVVASAVYPSAAILNHSCLPNTVLVYERGRPGSAPIVHGIYLGNGGSEELTHSYCDVTKPLVLRRRHLLQTHGFFCTCLRCTEQAEAATAVWTEDEEKLAESLSHAASRPLELRALLPQLSSSCSSSSSSSSSPLIRQHALVERLSTDRSSPFEYGRYQTKCRSLEEALVEGDIVAAVSACEQIVCCLSLFFSHLDFHPLLGLQLFTLGDLYRACEGREHEAEEIYAWCKDILSFTHTQIGSDLLQRLEESSAPAPSYSQD